MGQHLPTLNWESDKSGEDKAGGLWRFWTNAKRRNRYFNGGNGKSDRDNYHQQQACAKWLAEQEEPSQATRGLNRTIFGFNAYDKQFVTVFGHGAIG